MIFYFLFLILVILVVGFFCFSLLGSLWAEAPFVPTGQQELKWILKEVAKVQAGEVFYDLGSGDGRVARAAARLGARAIGFEQSWLLTLWAKLVWRISTPAPSEGGSTSFLRKNYLNEDLSGADVIFCYLMPEAMAHLKPKFERELKPGTRIVSRAFKIPGWTPQERWQFKKRTPPVYIYGAWQSDVQ